MSTPPLPSSHMPSHNAAVVIRERIKEKRLFEAQFLFGLLDEDDMPPLERHQLERELDGLLAVVRDLQLQANKYLSEGEHVLARKMHREIERIAIDVPGLEQGKRFVDERELAVRQAAPVVEQENLVDPAELSPDEETAEKERPVLMRTLTVKWPQLLTPLKDGYARLSKGKLMLAGSLFFLLAVIFLFLNLMRSQYSDASLKAQAGEGIAIKPLAVRPGESSTVHTDAPGQVQPAVPATPASTGSNAAITIRDLSVEPGSMQ